MGVKAAEGTQHDRQQAEKGSRVHCETSHKTKLHNFNKALSGEGRVEAGKGEKKSFLMFYGCGGESESEKTKIGNKI